jgi:hypothetical protein
VTTPPIAAEIIEQMAFERALRQFEHEWNSTVCPVCGVDKWQHHPFCRSCSIRLQRAHMMSPFKPYAGRSAAVLWRWASEEGGKHRRAFAGLFRHYDVSRDFLINVRREARA